jgi:hypothetical protein
VPVLAANPQTGAVGRPQPQTPQGSAGGPWIRYARTATRVGFTAVPTFGGGPITNPLPSAPGYARRLVVLTAGTGGTSTAAVVAGGDAPYNLFNPIQFKDPWGTPIITGDGYSILNLANKYSGQVGILQAADRSSLPSWSAIQTASGAGAGDFTFNSSIPVEGTKGYGVISIGNASVMPTLLMQPVPSSTFYGTAPGTLPTLSSNIDWEYYDVDPSNPVAPPGNGTTFQMVVVQGNQTIGLSSNTRVQVPRTGGYLTVPIFILRDSGNGNVRIDGYSSTGRVRLYVDGVPRFDDTFLELQDRMYEEFQTARPTGVIAYNFKDSLARLNLGLLDTLETAMQTNPGTLVELEMTPWGSSGTGPYILNCLQIQVVPAGTIAQGLVEQ